MKKLIAVGILSILTTSVSFAATNYFYQPFDTNYMMNQDIRKVTSVKNYTMNLDSNKIKIPAGVEIKARLQTISDESKLIYGQNVTAILEEEFNYKDSLILPIGTILEGNVIKKHEKSSEIFMQPPGNRHPGDFGAVLFFAVYRAQAFHLWALCLCQLAADQPSCGPLDCHQTGQPLV